MSWWLDGPLANVLVVNRVSKGLPTISSALATTIRRDLQFDQEAKKYSGSSSLRSQRDIDMTLIEFSAELLHCVFSFCSRSDLASLSQVNSTFQQAAEYLLYRHVHSSVYFGDDLQSQKMELRVHKLLFCTLASNPQKAALLRSLHVQLEIVRTEGTLIADDDAAMGQITDALRNAHGLLDLRINMLGHSDSCNAKVNEVIRSCHFQLHTLYTYSLWDLKGIIVGQKHLRLLGIHYPEYLEYSKFSELVNHLGHTGDTGRIDDNRKLPAIFLFSSVSKHFSKLILFPGLCLPGQAFTVCRDIATSLDRDPCNRYKISDEQPARDCHFAIDIFDFTHAKISTICEMIEAMAQYFSGCRRFTLLAQTSAVQGTVSKPWRIPGVLTSMSRFKQLRRLGFYVSGDDSLLHETMDLRSFVLEELVPACPTVIGVVVYNHSEVAYVYRVEYGWEISREQRSVRLGLIL